MKSIAQNMITPMASKDNGERASKLFKGQAHLYNIMMSFHTPMTVKWAIDLGIPDIIHNNHGQPITLSQLISALKVPQAKAPCIRRLMRLLVHTGVFALIKYSFYESKQEFGEEAYALTPTSELLVKGTDHSLCSMVELLSNPSMIAMHLHLGKWTYGEEKTIVETATGSTSFWDLIHNDPAHFNNFNAAMESDSHLVRLALRDSKSVFEGLDSLVELGGGTGNTAKIICDSFPNLNYIVLDLPHVVSGLIGTDNLSFVGGNMFESIPEADAILLKWILHDWNDDDCVKILRNCKKAISNKKKGGKIIIIDIVINEEQEKDDMIETKLLFDIDMMTIMGGMERDEKDWKRLFSKVGFKHYKIFPTFGLKSLIELYP